MMFDDGVAEAMQFGALVRRRREAAGLSRGQLAHRLGCAEETIERIELYGLEPNAHRMTALVRATLADEVGLWDHEPTSDLGLLD